LKRLIWSLIPGREGSLVHESLADVIITSHWRRRLALITGVMAALAIGWALWFALPCELILDVRVPEGTSSEYFSAAVLRRRQGHLTDEILQDWILRFPDRVAHGGVFRARLPRGEYRIVVRCENTDPFDERLRVGASRTLVVDLVAHQGHDGGSFFLP